MTKKSESMVKIFILSMPWERACCRWSIILQSAFSWSESSIDVTQFVITCCSRVTNSCLPGGIEEESLNSLARNLKRFFLFNVTLKNSCQLVGHLVWLSTLLVGPFPCFCRWAALRLPQKIVKSHINSLSDFEVQEVSFWLWGFIVAKGRSSLSLKSLKFGDIVVSWALG